MFFPGSRYEKTGTYTVTKEDGAPVAVAKLPLPRRTRLIGYHARKQGQRLDHIASRYLTDATAFWILCDANASMSPDALAARDLVGIPKKS
jgi:hypothetical protein